MLTTIKKISNKSDNSFFAFIRHADRHFGKNNDLTDLGEKNSQQFGLTLSGLVNSWKFDLWHTTIPRARQTAEGIAKGLNESHSVSPMEHFFPFLLHIHLGQREMFVKFIRELGLAKAVQKILHEEQPFIAQKPQEVIRECLESIVVPALKSSRQSVAITHDFSIMLLAKYLGYTDIDYVPFLGGVVFYRDKAEVVKHECAF